MMQLQFFDDAAEEIEESRAWYRARNPAVETSFLAELDHAIAQIAEGPQRWPKYLHGTRRYLLPKFPYSLIYFVERDALNIVAVAHHRRRPGYWAARITGR